MVPEIEFRNNSSVLRSTRDSKQSGISPESWLSNKFRFRRDERSPRDAGSTPLKEFENKARFSTEEPLQVTPNQKVELSHGFEGLDVLSVLHPVLFAQPTPLVLTKRSDSAPSSAAASKFVPLLSIYPVFTPWVFGKMTHTTKHILIMVHLSFWYYRGDTSVKAEVWSKAKLTSKSSETSHGLAADSVSISC
jgi:hypothetical protein